MNEYQMLEKTGYIRRARTTIIDGATKQTPVQFIRLMRVMSLPFGLGGRGAVTPLPPRRVT